MLKLVIVAYRTSPTLYNRIIKKYFPISNRVFMPGAVALIRTIAWKEVSCIKGRYLQTRPISLQIILGLPKIHSKTGYVNIEIRLGTRAKIILWNYPN